MPQAKEKTFKDLDFKAFGQNMTETVQNAIEKYWEKDTQVALRSINDFRELREDKAVKGLDFFSSKITVEKHKPVVFRLSKEFIKGFFDNILLSDSKHMRLEDLTKLELKILNNFCEFVYKKLKDVLLSPDKVHLSEKSETTVNLVFLVDAKSEESSYFILSVPLDRLDFKKIAKKQNFRDENFLTSSTTVRIKAGDTKISLEDLNHLAKGDIILLENSSSTKLTLISGEFKKQFNIKADSSLILNIDENEKNDYISDDEVTMENNLWDDIQIEVNAEFEKVKMTIGELKQITQGQIVDLGSVFDNEISLFVEDKKVAVGELLIVNNRYAVKLDKIIVPDSPQAKQKEPSVQNQKPQTPPRPQPKPQPKPQQKPQPKQANVDDEEFDYSDFEK